MEALGKGRKATAGRWQAAEEGGRHQGRAKARAAAGEGGRSKGRAQAQAAAGGAGARERQGHGQRGGGTGHSKGHGQGGRQEGAHRSQGPGAGKGPVGKEGGGDVGHHGQGRQGPGAGGEGKGKGRGRGGAEAPQPEVQALRCIPPGIQQMPAHHAHHHQPLPIYNIHPDLGALIPPKPSKVPRQPLPHLQGDALHDLALAVREPPAEPARLVAAPGARGRSAEPGWIAATPGAQEPWAEPARGAVGAPRPAEARSDWVCDWDAVIDLLGGQTLPLVLEVYGWLSWAA